MEGKRAHRTYYEIRYIKDVLDILEHTAKQEKKNSHFSLSNLPHFVKLPFIVCTLFYRASDLIFWFCKYSLYCWTKDGGNDDDDEKIFCLSVLN